MASWRRGHVCGRLPAQEEINFLPLKKGGVAHFAALFYFVSAQCLPRTIPPIASLSGKCREHSRPGTYSRHCASHLSGCLVQQSLTPASFPPHCCEVYLTATGFVWLNGKLDYKASDHCWWCRPRWATRFGSPDAVLRMRATCSMPPKAAASSGFQFLLEIAISKSLEPRLQRGDCLRGILVSSHRHDSVGSGSCSEDCGIQQSS